MIRCFVVRCAIVIAVLISFTPRVAEAQRAPAVEMSSVLNSVSIFPALGTLRLSNDATPVIAFLPANPKVDVVLTKAGEKEVLHSDEYRLGVLYSPFATMTPKSAPNFKFPAAGDYTLTWRVNKKPVTRLNFSVVFKKSDDAFDDRTVYFVQGPWEEWGYMFFPLGEGPDGDPQIRIWRQQMVLDGSKSSYRITAEIRKDGDVIAVSTGSSVGGQAHQDLQLALTHPESKGGKAFKAKDLVERDGTYHAVILREGKLDAVYPFEVKDGKPVPHERETDTYKERLDYIVPRYPGAGANKYNAGDNIWMKRLPDADAKRIFGGGSAPVAGPSAADKAAWVARSSADPNRRFELAVTDVPTRSDTNISAGDGVIAFGVGHPYGVRYLKVGESTARDIPDSETYSSRVFHVVGKKIVLLKRNQVVVFDTETGSTTVISKSEIHLYDEVGGLHYRNLINVDGNLVATINKATEVTDNTIVKVIDISGEIPRVIPIKNLNYTDNDVTSVDLDAANGHIAISSRNKKSIYVANIAPLANQKQFDLADYQGIGSKQIALTGDSIIYADSQDKLRSLNVGTGTSAAADLGAIGNTSRGFFARGDQLAVATTEKYGSRYQFVTGEVSRLVPAKNLAEKLEGTSGGMGMAGCAAIAEDGTVFIAGTDSIGVGEHLQALQGDTWTAIYGADGKALYASDVVAGQHLIAFKSQDADKQVRVAYATYGARIALPAVGTAPPVVGSNTTPNTASPSTTSPPPTGNPNEAAKAQLAAALDESERETIAGFIEAGMSKEEAERMAIAAINKSRANAGLPLKPVPGEDSPAPSGDSNDESGAKTEAPTEAKGEKEDEGGGGGTIIVLAVLLLLLGGGGFFAAQHIRKSNMEATAGDSEEPPATSP